MKNKIIVLGITAALSIIIVLGIVLFLGKPSGRSNVEHKDESVLCSGINILENDKDKSLMEYNGYYVKEQKLCDVIEEHRSEIEEICNGDFEITYYSKNDDATYVVFNNGIAKGKSGIILYQEDGATHITVCEDVKYIIEYEKGSKGDCADFIYNENTALDY